VSSAVVAVPCVSVAPAVITQGSRPGEATFPAPSLPAAATTVIPDAQACSTATDRGSAAHGAGLSNPNDRFSTRMLFSSA
jgi:hypothetical protein